MKYAFYPGCVSRGGAPELYASTMAIAGKLDLELEEIVGAACTGAGVLQEKGLKLGDALNARTFAMAERMGLTTILNVCSTCQGVMAQANHRLLADPDYLDEINEELKPEGLEYTGRVVIKHLAWVIVEEVGIDRLKSLVTHPLPNLKVAPFYGCYILRPSWALGFDENPGREYYLEQIIEACGAEPCELPGAHEVLRLPHHAHQRAQLDGDGGEPHGERPRARRGRDGDALSAVPPEPRRPAAEGRGAARREDRNAHPAPAADDRPRNGASGEGVGPRSAHRQHALRAR